MIQGILDTNWNQIPSSRINAWILIGRPQRQFFRVILWWDQFIKNGISKFTLLDSGWYKIKFPSENSLKFLILSRSVSNFRVLLPNRPSSHRVILLTFSFTQIVKEKFWFDVKTLKFSILEIFRSKMTAREKKLSKFRI